MRVLGIDPGSLHMGWGVVDAHGSTLRHVASGTLHAPDNALFKRLRFMADWLDQIIAQYQPQAAAVEMVFHAKNSKSALTLGHARGVALLCVARSAAGVFEYSAGQIKQAVTGRGRADKDQVQTMVRLLLGLRDDTMAHDTSDALAAAICHHNMSTGAAGFLQRQERDKP